MPTKLTYPQLSNTWSIGAGLGIVATAAAGVVILFSGKNASGVVTYKDLSDGSREQSGSLLVKSGSLSVTLFSNGNATMQGTLSGNHLYGGTMSGAGLTDCDQATNTLNWDATTKRFLCTTSLQTSLDSRYLNTHGDTGTGRFVFQRGLSVSGSVVWNTSRGSGALLIDDGNIAGLAFHNTADRTKLSGALYTQRTANQTILYFGEAGTTIGDIGLNHGIYIISDEDGDLEEFQIYNAKGGFFDATMTNVDTKIFVGATKSQTQPIIQIYSGSTALPYLFMGPSGKVGIGTTTPDSSLEIIGTASGQILKATNSMRIDPRASPPGSPVSGDMYVDSTPSPDEMCFYDGSAWQGISSGTDANCS